MIFFQTYLNIYLSRLIRSHFNLPIQSFIKFSHKNQDYLTHLKKKSRDLIDILSDALQILFHHFRNLLLINQNYHRLLVYKHQQEILWWRLHSKLWSFNFQGLLYRFRQFLKHLAWFSLNKEESIHHKLAPNRNIYFHFNLFYRP